MIGLMQLLRVRGGVHAEERKSNTTEKRINVDFPIPKSCISRYSNMSENLLNRWLK